MACGVLTSVLVSKTPFFGKSCSHNPRCARAYLLWLVSRRVFQLVFDGTFLSCLRAEARDRTVCSGRVEGAVQQGLSHQHWFMLQLATRNQKTSGSTES